VDAIKALTLIGIGLIIVYGGTVELVGWFRARRRLRWVTGVIVGHTDPGTAVDPGTVSRSAVFEFTTDDGAVVRATSSAWSFPGPKVGKRIRVSYDPAKPHSSSEPAGVLSLKVVLSPLLMALGFGLAIYGLTFL
jgi:Protein of unknown function (DUF3592)